MMSSYPCASARPEPSKAKSYPLHWFLRRSISVSFLNCNVLRIANCATDAVDVSIILLDYGVLFCALPRRSGQSDSNIKSKRCWIQWHSINRNGSIRLLRFALLGNLNSSAGLSVTLCELVFSFEFR